MHASLSSLFAARRQAFNASPYPTLAQRRARLKALRQQLLGQQQALYSAAASDFGKRSASETRLLEVLPSINSIDYSQKHLKSWLKAQKRHVSWLFQPASNQVFYQPLGVVGIIVPWNYPIFLALGPLVAAIAAGDQVMLKLSEFTPALNQVLKNIIEQALPDCAVVVEGDAAIAAAFSQLPFDHLLFTGSTDVGRRVMQSAADNLTPVTLELGGKSPVLLAPDIRFADFAGRLLFGKCANSGQTCVAPDYVLVPAGREQELTDCLQRTFADFYPQGSADPHWTSVINDRQWQRLQQALAEASAAGARIVSCDDKPWQQSQQRQLALQLVFDAPLDCTLWQQEIFGPVLPVYSYRTVDEAIAFIQQRPRPLAFYLFSLDASLQQRCLEQIHAGGVCLNDSLVHVGQDDLPFGGVGPSGLGHYHGHEGFLTFSHAKAVHRKGRFGSGFLAYPQIRAKLLDKVLDLWLGKVNPDNAAPSRHPEDSAR